MSNRLDTAAAAAMLARADRIHILSHASPDGDTLGCGYGLCLALQQMGKNARVAVIAAISAHDKYFFACFLCFFSMGQPP